MEVQYLPAGKRGAGRVADRKELLKKNGGEEGEEKPAYVKITIMQQTCLNPRNLSEENVSTTRFFFCKAHLLIF